MCPRLFARCPRNPAEGGFPSSQRSNCNDPRKTKSFIEYIIFFRDSRNSGSTGKRVAKTAEEGTSKFIDYLQPTQQSISHQQWNIALKLDTYFRWLNRLWASYKKWERNVNAIDQQQGGRWIYSRSDRHSAGSQTVPLRKFLLWPTCCWPGRCRHPTSPSGLSTKLMHHTSPWSQLPDPVGFQKEKQFIPSYNQE